MWIFRKRKTILLRSLSSNPYAQVVKNLEEVGVVFDDGLTSKEVFEIEKKFEFQFPVDLRDFLKTALPIKSKDGSPFPNWRKSLQSKKVEQDIRESMEWPQKSLIEDENFWYKPWGPKPETGRERRRIFTEKFPNYPKLIPILSHRYISVDPRFEGNPVFSVYGSDTIIYGEDFISYLEHEFHIDIGSFPKPRKKNNIHFWSNVVLMNSQMGEKEDGRIYFEYPDNPKSEEIRWWVQSDASDPYQDFDMILGTTENVELLIELYLDDQTKAKKTILRSLYAMTQYIDNDKKEKIWPYVDKEYRDEKLSLWAQRSKKRALEDIGVGLAGEEYNKWCFEYPSKD